jgi:Zinc finger, ZZ type
MDDETLQNESQDLLDLLYSISEDQAHKGLYSSSHQQKGKQKLTPSFVEGYIHRTITCNHCRTAPIRGFRFKCANCPDFDICEHCEALDSHDKTHVFLKIRIPIPPLANLRTSLVPPFYPGTF